jgi:hypothetical protein
MKALSLNSSAKSAVSRLFSSSVFRELATTGKSALFARLVHESCLFETRTVDALVRDAFETAFACQHDKISRRCVRQKKASIVFAR